MKILCISGSNVVHKRNDSGSTKTCELIQQIILGKTGKTHEIKILPLVEFNFKPCIFCGNCQNSNHCPYDPDFNSLYLEISHADLIYMVIPHYSIIPAKITMIMEKLNQLYYTAWLKSPDEPYPTSDKYVGLIGHGGSDEQSNEHYRQMILTPMEYIFTSMGFNVLGNGEENPNGIVFGVNSLKNDPSSIFPTMVHNWAGIEEKLTKFIEKNFEKMIS